MEYLPDEFEELDGYLTFQFKDEKEEEDNEELKQSEKKKSSFEVDPDPSKSEDQQSVVESEKTYKIIEAELPEELYNVNNKELMEAHWIFHSRMTTPGSKGDIKKQFIAEPFFAKCKDNPVQLEIPIVYRKLAERAKNTSKKGKVENLYVEMHSVGEWDKPVKLKGGRLVERMKNLKLIMKSSAKCPNPIVNYENFQEHIDDLLIEQMRLTLIERKSKGRLIYGFKEAPPSKIFEFISNFFCCSSKKTMEKQEPEAKEVKSNPRKKLQAIKEEEENRKEVDEQKKFEPKRQWKENEEIIKQMMIERRREKLQSSVEQKSNNEKHDKVKGKEAIREETPKIEPSNSGGQRFATLALQLAKNKGSDSRSASEQSKRTNSKPQKIK